MITQKAQLGAQALHLIEQIEHGFEPGQIQAANGPQVLDLPDGNYQSNCEDAMGC
jgi:hypothetical protein